MNESKKRREVTVSVKLDADRVRQIDEDAKVLQADRSQILRWAIEAYLLYKKATRESLNPKLMEELIQRANLRPGAPSFKFSPPGSGVPNVSDLIEIEGPWDPGSLTAIAEEKTIYGKPARRTKPK